MGKYIEFKLLERINDKNKVIGVISILHGIKLGVIRLNIMLNQYLFYPEKGISFNGECLRDIKIYMDGINR